MTEQERLDRETLLRRAATAAGAVYVAPVLTSAAAADVTTCAGQPCAPGRKGNKTCRRKGGTNCKCVDGSCVRVGCELRPCQYHGTCQFVEPCPGPGRDCVCACVIQGQQPPRYACMQWESNFCSAYPRCYKDGDGSDCPPGRCCFDAHYCPEGICGKPCGTSSAVEQRRELDSAPRQLLEGPWMSSHSSTTPG